MEFAIFPAIDLRAGRVVRLRQGNPLQESEYHRDPIKAVDRWLSAGAAWLHVVNLDGAFGQTSHENQQALESILAAASHYKDRWVQFGGGLRDRDQISRVIEMGVRRVVLGTLAVENPELVANVVKEFGPNRIVVGIDAREGDVLTRGWARSAGNTAMQLGVQMASLGLHTVIFTDVSRDGTGAGLNVIAAKELTEKTGLNVIVSGGVDGLEDVRAAKQAGLSGVVIGRALYEGRFSLEEALKC